MARLLIAAVFAILALTAIAQSPASAPSASPLPAVSLPPTAAAPTTATPPPAAAPTTVAGPTAAGPTTVAGEGPTATVSDGPAAGEGPSGSPTDSPSNGAVSMNRVAIAGGSFVAVAMVAALVF